MVSTSWDRWLRLDSSRAISSRRRCSDSAWTLRAWASASAISAGGLGLGVGLGLVDELLGQQQRPLQRVVGDRPARPGGRRRAGASGLAASSVSSWAMRLGRLAQPLGALAQLLLQAFGLDGRLLEVLVDVVPVVALQGLAELHGAERVECRLGSVHAAMVAAAPGNSRDSSGPRRGATWSVEPRPRRRSDRPPAGRPISRKTVLIRTSMTRKTTRTDRSRPTPPTRTGGMIRRTGRSTGSQIRARTRLDLEHRRVVGRAAPRYVSQLRIE